MLSPVLVGPILRLKCMDAQCISNTTRVCRKAIEKHFFLLLPLSNETRPHVIREQLLSKLPWIKENVVK